MSSSESFSDLRKEIARYKESDLTSASYIASMEARLARNDADMASLRATIEKLEAEAESRAEEVSQLQGRVDALMQERMDKENWKASLLEREKRVEELEKRMEEWERVKNEVSEERERLGNAVGEVEQAKKSLLMEVERREAASNETSSERPSQPESHSTTYYTPRSTLSATLGTITPGTPSTPVAQPVSLSPAAIPSELPLPALQEEFQSLQKEHSETLADLSSVTSKYRDALREISDLAAQISEAKLQLATTANSGDSDVGSDAGRPKTPKTPTPVRRKTLTRRESSGVTLLNGAASTSNGGTTGTGRRLFFRHATSAESLHSRSQSQSQSLSQELSSRPLSPRSPRQSWTSGDSLLVPPKLSIHVPHNQESTRSMESLEKEIMRLQEVTYLARHDTVIS
jgi:predicted  nucleic acid-binding Zn-ribbon protein